MDYLRTCYSSRWELPGYGEVRGYYFFNDEAPEYQGWTYLGSRNWHAGDGTEWPPYGELEGVRQRYRKGEFLLPLPEARLLNPSTKEPSEVIDCAPIDVPTFLGIPLTCWSNLEIDTMLTVRELDGDPTINSVVVVTLDQGDGFVLSEPEAGEALIGIASASQSQRGVISLEDQILGIGNKRIGDYLIHGPKLLQPVADFDQIADFLIAFNITGDLTGGAVALSNSGGWSFGASMQVVTFQQFANGLQIQQWASGGTGSLLQSTFYFTPAHFSAPRIVSPDFRVIDTVPSATGTYGGLTISGGIVTAIAGPLDTSQISDYLGATTALIDAAIAALKLEADPFPQYLTPAEGNALYTPIGVTQYTDEMAQDAVGGILASSANVTLTYNDGAPSIAADLTDVGTAGTYPKVTTDAKGRVTAGSALVVADLPTFDGLADETALADDDELPYFRQGSGANRSITMSNARLYFSRLVARQYAEYTTHATLSTTIPYDDSLPQNTEGTEILTVSITPKNAANRIRVRFQCCAGTSVASGLTAALFVDSDANAIAATGTVTSGGGSLEQLALEYETAAGSTSARTYKIRVGAGSDNAYVNGDSSSRRYGGAARATLVVEELLP